jgi:hypothetical protein
MQSPSLNFAHPVTDVTSARKMRIEKIFALMSLLLSCHDDRGLAFGETVPNQLHEIRPRESGFNPELLHLDIPLRPANQALVAVPVVRTEVHGCSMDLSVTNCKQFISKD